MQARDIMTSQVETVDPDDDISDVLIRFANVKFNGFPVTDNGIVVGIVTQSDLVTLFQAADRTLWIPVGFPPFLESLTYAVDISWDELEIGMDFIRNANKPIRSVMTEDVVTVRPETDIDEIIELLTNEDRDINRLPVVDEAGAIMGIIARQDVLRAIREIRET